jgi:hypothetical protein
MPITASGVISASTSMTLTDSDVNSTSTVTQSNSLSSVTKPSTLPTAPTATEQTYMYADRIFKKTYLAVSNVTATTVLLGSTFPDLFCNTGNITYINSVSVKNSSNAPINFVFNDLTGATGDIIKVPAYGYVQIGAPLNGITVAAANFTLQCASAGLTADATVTIAYQR